MNALIIDDEADIGFMISRFLSKEGIKTDHVTHLKGARKQLKTQEYQFFFLDLNLPDGSGFELIPEIRNQERKAFVIIISAYDEMDKARSMGIDFYIKKPFTKQEIIATINNFL